MGVAKAPPKAKVPWMGRRPTSHHQRMARPPVKDLPRLDPMAQDPTDRGQDRMDRGQDRMDRDRGRMAQGQDRMDRGRGRMAQG